MFSSLDLHNRVSNQLHFCSLHVCFPMVNFIFLLPVSHLYFTSMCKATHVIPSLITCTTRVVPGLVVSNHLSFHKLISTIEWSPRDVMAAQVVKKFCAIPKWHHIPEHWNLPIIKPMRCTSFSNIVFCSITLHVLDGLFVHHQESIRLHTASGVCQTDSADCLLVGTRWNWFYYRNILQCMAL
jgi:hypothetical protein